MFVTRTLEQNENDVKHRQAKEVAKSFPFSIVHNMHEAGEQSDTNDEMSLNSARSND